MYQLGKSCHESCTFAFLPLILHSEAKVAEGVLHPRLEVAQWSRTVNLSSCLSDTNIALFLISFHASVSTINYLYLHVLLAP